MKDKIPYLRVGTTYYKTIEKPLISGDKISILVRWNRETIISDHGKIYVSKIPKYDGFCCIPSHLQYQKIIEGFYNMYNEIPFQPINEELSSEALKKQNYIFPAVYGAYFRRTAGIGIRLHQNIA